MPTYHPVELQFLPNGDGVRPYMPLRKPLTWGSGATGSQADVAGGAVDGRQLVARGEDPLQQGRGCLRCMECAQGYSIGESRR